jgi:hypothetical protein
MRAVPWVVAGLFAAAAALAVWRLWPRGPGPAEIAALYTPLSPPSGPLATYHLGHSLVGRDMPAMLAAAAGHAYASQLGWGASLRDHWRGEVRGFAEENAHPAFRPAGEALDGGTYDAVIFTEMVELRDAIRYHDSAATLALWAARAHAGNPDARLYLYETWHRLDDSDGWLARIDGDLDRLWRARVLTPAVARSGLPIRLIPAGQALAAAVRAAEAGQVPGLTRREDFFALTPDGAVDPIHLNATGAWLVAMAHYAVLYHRSPAGLPGVLPRADGTPGATLAPETAQALQAIVWQVVIAESLTGVAAGDLAPALATGYDSGGSEGE